MRIFCLHRSVFGSSYCSLRSATYVSHPVLHPLPPSSLLSTTRQIRTNFPLLSYPFSPLPALSLTSSLLPMLLRDSLAVTAILNPEGTTAGSQVRCSSSPFMGLVLSQADMSGSVSGLVAEEESYSMHLPPLQSDEKEESAPLEERRTARK